MTTEQLINILRSEEPISTEVRREIADQLASFEILCTMFANLADDYKELVEPAKPANEELNWLYLDPVKDQA